VLDLATFEYRASAKPALRPEMAKNAASTQERLRSVAGQRSRKDKAAGFLWPFLAALWNFAADRIGEVAKPMRLHRSSDESGLQLGAGRLRCGCGGVESTVWPHEGAGDRGKPVVDALLLPSGRRGTRWMEGNASSRQQTNRSRFPRFPAMPRLRTSGAQTAWSARMRALR